MRKDMKVKLKQLSIGFVRKLCLMHLNMQKLMKLLFGFLKIQGNLELHVMDEGAGFDLNEINPKGTGLGPLWNERTCRTC